MKTQTITLKEYCQLAGFNYESRNVHRQLREGTLLPGMVQVSKFGRSWMVTVLDSWYEDGKEDRNV